MKKDGRVTVITATIGHPHLARALRSVLCQTYEKVDHWVVVDGPEFQCARKSGQVNDAGRFWFFRSGPGWTAGATIGLQPQFRRS